MVRIILIALGVAVVGAVGVFMFVLSSLDGLIQEAVQTYGSEITKGKVVLSKVEVDLTSGKGALRGLTIGNPAGFKTPSAFDLGAITLDIDTGTVTDDTIVINEIVIEGPVITYELGSDGSNIDAIQRNVEAYMAKFGGGGEESAAAEDGEGPKLVINDLFIRGGAVNVSASFLDGKTLGTDLPDIHLEDIGKEDDGASPAEIAEQIIAAITEGTTGAVSGLGLEDMMSNAGKVLEGVTEGLTEGAAGMIEGITEGSGGGAVTESAGEVMEGAGDAVGSAVEGAGDALGGAADGAADALGNLFGGSSD